MRARETVVIARACAVGKGIPIAAHQLKDDRRADQRGERGDHHQDAQEGDAEGEPDEGLAHGDDRRNERGPPRGDLDSGRAEHHPVPAEPEESGDEDALDHRPGDEHGGPHRQDEEARGETRVRAFELAVKAVAEDAHDVSQRHHEPDRVDGRVLAGEGADRAGGREGGDEQRHAGQTDAMPAPELGGEGEGGGHGWLRSEAIELFWCRPLTLDCICCGEAASLHLSPGFAGERSRRFAAGEGVKRPGL